ncbi:binding-protein-dependent transport systems inner membrane component [Petrotoga mobilis SJ95]|uniref:Binding-protein-dependent transport systems inner membrane component n=1 Tax=Petrotoga mobilis (strain DSM 10674 / SJ95) TaxID=403833 RepID=A9BH28_PETMO|nr:sugar ABC transporter permease [Petrotoga mobilis]ABX31258.1 binding-protein-dependent transport systems inner membrane component [Petrotoga mobilis SJ95]
MKLSRKKQTYLIAFCFLVAPLVLLGIFSYYPIVRGITLSFADYNMLTGETKWVGLKNYRWLFNYKYFYISLANTLKYLIVVPFIQFASMGLAVLVNQKIPGIKFFRTLFYVPVITGSVIVSIAWRWIFDVDGILNYFLMSLNIIEEPVLWLLDKNVALFSCMFVTFWRGLGYYMIIYLAGLQNIPSELYEAAALDGASNFKKFTRITIPLLRPTMLLCFVLSTMSALKVFEEIFLLTGGANQTTTLMFETYNLAFNRYQFGRSAAVGVIFSAFLITLTLIQFKFFGLGGVGGENEKKRKKTNK